MEATDLTVAFDPQDPRIVYAGGDDGCGVLRSTNGGKSWHKAGLNGCAVYKKNGYWKKATGQAVSALAIAPNGRVLYAGTSLNLGSVQSPAVFRSVNGGRSWRWVSDSPGGEIPLLVVDPKNPRILYTSTQGVFKSTDGGVSWHELNLPPAAAWWTRWRSTRTTHRTSTRAPTVASSRAQTVERVGESRGLMAMTWRRSRLTQSICRSSTRARSEESSRARTLAGPGNPLLCRVSRSGR
jgi:hypothetical protein